MTTLTVTTVGGPTALLEIGGLKLLTDPTFDPPGSYELRPGVRLTKTLGPAFAPLELPHIDVVLLSHDHHKDNLDDSGREFLSQTQTVLTTVTGAERLGGNSTALQNWESVEIPRPDGGSLRVTGLPAQHGPDGSEHLVGEVTGFLLSGAGLPSVYVSGDNASLDVVQRIAARVGAVDVAILFLGGAQMPYLGDAYLTLPSAKAPQAARILGVRAVVPVHTDGWAHFSDDRQSLARAFEEAQAGDLLLMAPLGSALAIGD